MTSAKMDLTGRGSASSSGSASLTLASSVDRVVASRIRALRGARGLTQRDLADRVAALGVKIDQSRIARIERGSATVNLADAIAIALALEVSVEGLIVPSEGHEMVNVTPTIT